MEFSRTSYTLQNKLTDFEWQRFASYSRLAVLCDTQTAIYCYPKVKPFLPSHDLIIIAHGEEHKTLASCEQVWKSMLKLDRQSFLLCLGGGMVGDLGGFCAAVFKRGIAFGQMPTTLLAMVDASIGGKTGIDFHGLKNHLGTFSRPEIVWVWPGFLQTLPQRELTSGFAEIVKHGLLQGAAHWQAVKTTTPHSNKDWLPIIRLSMAFKVAVVEKDPDEKGLRRILNFGHTVGHALESFALQSGKPILHGEAVAIGLVAESWLSHRICGLPEDEFHEIAQFICTHFEPRAIPSANQLWNLAQNDKKNTFGNVQMALLEAIGKPIASVKVERSAFDEAIAVIKGIFQ